MPPPGGTNTIDFAIPGTASRRSAGLAPARDHQPRADRRHHAAGLRRHAADRARRPRVAAGAPTLSIWRGGERQGLDSTVSASRAASTSATLAYAIGRAYRRAPLASIVAYPIRYRGRGADRRRSRHRGLTTLSLLDAQGHGSSQSDGLSAAEPVDLIDTYLAPGTYSLRVRSTAARLIHLDDHAHASHRRRSADPGRGRASRHRGGRLHRRRPARPGRRQGTANGTGVIDPVVGAAGQRRRHVPAPGHLRGRVGPRSPSWRVTSPATATSTWPSPTPAPTTVSVLLGNGDGTFQPQVTYAVGSSPDAIVAGDFTGDGQLDLAVANRHHRRGIRPPIPTPCRCCWATATARSSPRSPTRSGSEPDAIVAGDFTGDGQLDLAVANSHDSTVSVLLGNGDGTFQPQVTYAVGSVSRRHRGGRLHRRRPARPGRRRCVRAYRCCWATATARSSPRDRTRREPESLVAGDFTGDGHLDLAVSTTYRQRVGAAGQRRRHLPAPGHLRGGVVPRRDRGG